MLSYVRVLFCYSVSVVEGLLVTLRKEGVKDIPTCVSSNMHYYQ